MVVNGRALVVVSGAKYEEMVEEDNVTFDEGRLILSLPALLLNMDKRYT